MKTQAEKGRLFRDLHYRDSAFVIPNPWDIGSARILAGTGFEALATTSVGYANSIGRQDHGVTRNEMIAHAATLAAATELPVSADLENGFGDDPETVAETIRMAAGAGLAGCSIEDSTNRDDDPIYSFEHSVDRIRAAVEQVRNLPFPFMLTARSENYLHGRKDLADTIKRLQAFQEAGADVLYAPGMTDVKEIATLISSVDRPVNVLAGMQGTHFDVNELSRIGAKRISVGGALTRIAFAAVLHAAREMKERGTFTFIDEPITSREIAALISSAS
ncbi:MAG TPA: isocitrate lyase/phosphoenolpyruvate mutase family protein [Gemmatimonadaceae bacterium]|nr:isocitrate lyase/phosphoenolpyruvate mutase family protein [Gemmatimonadaceae bacterium]